MTDHLCRERTPGCYRCDLGADEALAAEVETLTSNITHEVILSGESSDSAYVAAFKCYAREGDDCRRSGTCYVADWFEIVGYDYAMSIDHATGEVRAPVIIEERWR